MSVRPASGPPSAPASGSSSHVMPALSRSAPSALTRSAAIPRSGPQSWRRGAAAIERAASNAASIVSALARSPTITLTW